MNKKVESSFVELIDELHNHHCAMEVICNNRDKGLNGVGIDDDEDAQLYRNHNIRYLEIIDELIRRYSK